MDKSEILHFLTSKKQELHQSFGLVKIGLFGSYARGEERGDSDIDLAVEIESENKFRSFFGLKNYLEKELSKNIDIGIESTLKPIVKNSIKSEIIYV